MATFNPRLPGGGRYNYNTLGNNWAGSATGTPNPATFPTTGQLPDDEAVYDAGAQAFVNKRTRIPWSGRLKNGGFVHQGKLAADPGGDPNQFDPNRYSALSVTKNPDIDSAANDLLDRFKKGADAMLGFDAHLKAASAGADAAFKAGQDATNIEPYQTNLRSAVDRYGNRLDQASTDYANLNTDAAQRQRDIVARENALLPQYDAAGQAIADRQIQLAGANVNRYKLGTGTPRSLGGSELSLMASAATDALLPLKQAQLAKRYELLGNEANVENMLASRETSRISQFEPQIAGAQFNSQADAEKAIQTFKMAAASQNWQNVVQMLQVPAMAAEIRNRIQMGDAALLAALTQLRSNNRYQGLVDKAGVLISQPQGYNMQTPGYPSAGRYAQPGRVTTSGTGTLAPGANTPVDRSQTSRPYSSSDYAYQAQTGVFPDADPNFDQGLYDRIVARTNNGAQPASGRYQSAASGVQSNSYYDARLGAFVDRTTGQITGYSSGADLSTADPYSMNTPAYD